MSIARPARASRLPNDGHKAANKVSHMRQQSSLKLACLLGVSLLGVASAAQARQAAEPNTALEEVVVTAERRSENLQRVPLSVAAVGGDQLRAVQAGGEDILALSGRVPSLYAETTTGRIFPRFYIRGLGNTDFGFYFLNYHSRLPLLSGKAVSTAALSGTPASLTAGFFVEYPEDIQMFGMSWNTTLPGGVAWQGEISHRPNMPLQVDDVELLFAALSPLNPFVAGTALDFCSQLNPAGCAPLPGGFGSEVRGYRRHEVSQLQMTFTKAFSEVLGADQLALVGEIGATEVWDLPPASELRYEGEGTDTGGGFDVNDCTYITVPGVGQVPVVATCPAGALRNPQSLTGGFPTQFSWGYRLAARADYNAVFGSSINLSPRLAFNHDVSGITPGPGGNFLEGRKSGTIGLEANYQNKLVFDLSYTAFFGGEPYNQIADRDFASFTVKYSF